MHARAHFGSRKGRIGSDTLDSRNTCHGWDTPPTLASAQMPRLCDLTGNVLFEGVTPEGIQMALEGATRLTYQCGEVLIRQDAHGEAIYLLLSGAARVSRAGLGGRVRMLGDLYAPAVLGETAVLAAPRRSATVTALGEVRALVIYRDQLERVMNRHPRVLWNLARLLAAQVAQLHDELLAAGISTEANMVQVLLQMQICRRKAGIPQPEVLDLNTTDLALRLSSSRETIHRLLRRLEGRRLVEVRPGTVRVLDPEGLEHLFYKLSEG